MKLPGPAEVVDDARIWVAHIKRAVRRHGHSLRGVDISLAHVLRGHFAIQVRVGARVEALDGRVVGRAIIVVRHQDVGTHLRDERHARGSANAVFERGQLAGARKSNFSIAPSPLWSGERPISRLPS